MSGMNESQLGLALSNLMDAKLGRHRDWQMPEIRKTVGPYSPSAFSKYDAQRRRIVSECRIKLASYTNEQIEILTIERRDDPDEIVNEWHGFLRNEIRALEKQKPVWFAAGFGHPDYQADFEYWGQMERYSLHESLLLSVGVEPKHFSEHDLEKVKSASDRVTLSPQIEFLIRRHELFLRRFPSRGNGPLRVTPTFLVEWFDEVALEVHPKLLDALRRRVLAILEPSKSLRQTVQTISSARPDKREIDKIAQLFTAMAIDQLGYDPAARRSPIPKEIVDLSASMGLNVSEDTVRKYLKLGAGFVPEGWKPN